MCSVSAQRNIAQPPSILFTQAIGLVNTEPALFCRLANPAFALLALPERFALKDSIADPAKNG
jgi:hypothetical protein